MQLALELTEPDLPLRDIAAAWQAVQVHRPSTAAIHDGLLRRHILPRFGDRGLCSISTSEVQAWVRDLLQHLAPATLERAFQTLRAVFAHAKGDGLIARNPCAGVRRPRIERPPITPPTPEEIGAIVRVADARYRALVILAAGTGLRRGECLGLTQDRIDTANAVITVDRQLVEMPGEPPALGPPKTPASYRRVPLPARLDGEPVTVVQARLGHSSGVRTLDTYGHLWPDDGIQTREAVDDVFLRAHPSL